MAKTLLETEVLCVCCHDFLAEVGGEDGLRTKRAVREFLEQSGLRVVQRPEPNLAPYVRDQVWAYHEQLTGKAASWGARGRGGRRVCVGISDHKEDGNHYGWS